MTFIEHVATHLGDPLASGIFAERLSQFQFQDQGAHIFVSTGLGNFNLHDAYGRHRYIEFMIAQQADDWDDLPDVLAQLVYQTSVHRFAPTRGDIIGPADDIFLSPEVHMNALYIALPVYWDDTLFEPSHDNNHTELLWAIPIHAEEADFVLTHGHEAFEDLLVQQDPNLFDLRRPPVSLQ